MISGDNELVEEENSFKRNSKDPEVKMLNLKVLQPSQITVF